MNEQEKEKNKQETELKERKKRKTPKYLGSRFDLLHNTLIAADSSMMLYSYFIECDSCVVE